jgi:uncharacterized SAM-binding protein YcdF (DUF218 family)
MYILKQFLKTLILPPFVWFVLLLIVLVFWKRSWARKLLGVTLVFIFILHSAILNYALGYWLETRYAPLYDPRKAGTYDAIVVLTGASIPPTGLIPFPSIQSSMFRRLEEALRLYRLDPKPVLISGGHSNPFTPSRGENGIACDYLRRWGVPPDHVFAEGDSRDTFESALAVRQILAQKGWRRYLLVTSATHMPRSMQVFSRLAPEPIAAPGDFTTPEWAFSPLSVRPSEGAAGEMAVLLNEYVGMVNYAWRLRFGGP